MLAGYGELEVDLCNCIAMGGVGTDAAVKRMFRPRGERKRIDTAVRIGAPFFDRLGLESDFAKSIVGMRYCLSIRNQYAHCQWYDDYSGKLALVNMEEIAHTAEIIKNYFELDTRYVDVPLLEQQETYFALVVEAFSFVNYEGRKRAGTLPCGHIFQMPQLGVPPPLHL
jgi:hypothetical protein